MECLSSIKKGEIVGLNNYTNYDFDNNKGVKSKIVNIHFQSH